MRSALFKKKNREIGGYRQKKESKEKRKKKQSKNEPSKGFHIFDRKDIRAGEREKKLHFRVATHTHTHTRSTVSSAR